MNRGVVLAASQLIDLALLQVPQLATPVTLGLLLPRDREKLLWVEQVTAPTTRHDRRDEILFTHREGVAFRDALETSLLLQREAEPDTRSKPLLGMVPLEDLPAPLDHHPPVKSRGIQESRAAI